jgi:hypothetical protein
MKRWEQQRPTRWQTEKGMRSLGKVMVVVSLILGAAIIGRALILHNDTLLTLLDPKNLGSLSGCAVGAILLKKPYWKDPAFCQARREKMLQLVLDSKSDEAKKLNKVWELGEATEQLVEEREFDRNNLL